MDYKFRIKKSRNNTQLLHLIVFYALFISGNLFGFEPITYKSNYQFSVGLGFPVFAQYSDHLRVKNFLFDNHYKFQESFFLNSARLNFEFTRFKYFDLSASLESYPRNYIYHALSQRDSIGPNTEYDSTVTQYFKFNSSSFSVGILPKFVAKTYIGKTKAPFVYKVFHIPFYVNFSSHSYLSHYDTRTIIIERDSSGHMINDSLLTNFNDTLKNTSILSLSLSTGFDTEYHFTAIPIFLKLSLLYTHYFIDYKKIDTIFDKKFVSDSKITYPSPGFKDLMLYVAIGYYR